MRFIDQQEIELDLPANWNETVQAAWVHVDNKVEQAGQCIIDKAADEGWEGEVLAQKIIDAKVTARKKAITYKGSVWSGLRDQLAEPSKGKCWYCETNEIRSDNPIDHFRPKNSVSECDDHPGYWWLAFDWKNYRYSCTYCNSRRVEVETAGGKQDHFPIFIPPDWNKCEADQNIERPMLLDPIDSDDCKLITFNNNGEVCSVVEDKDSDEYKRVEKSIELYHFNHKPTTRARRAIFQRIDTLISSTNNLIGEGVDEKSEAIKSNKTEIIRLIRPQCKSTKFNTAARVYLKRFEDQVQWVKDILDQA